MSEQRLLFLDIEPKSNSSSVGDRRTDKPIWTCSDNTFKFNFFLNNSSPLQEESSVLSDRSEPVATQISFTGQGHSFAFNFQIPAATPVEDMETADAPERQQDVHEETTLPEQSVQSKAKKKKKPGKKKPSNSTEQQQKSTSAEGSLEAEDTELSAEEQLNRQLDWCIEQLELGMRSQKGTPKQKEEASHALKTLRSSKAPLVKKRQVMRAMAGDYRKKMEEEKTKQYKLIQNEVASAQVKVASNSQKKCVFHRKAEVKAETSATEDNQQSSEVLDRETKGETTEESSAFVFTPSKEEFRFNFL